MAGRKRTPGRREPKPFDARRAWEYLLFILARRQYTVAQLRERLVKRGLPAEEAEPLLKKLIDLRLVNDELFAEQYVHSRKSSRGRLSLKQELNRKGVDEQLVQQQLAELSPEQQAAAATALLLRNEWRYRPSDDGNTAAASTDEADFIAHERRFKARSKAFAFLARRGFAADAAAAALERVRWFDDD